MKIVKDKMATAVNDVFSSAVMRRFPSGRIGVVTNFKKFAGKYLSLSLSSVTF